MAFRYTRPRLRHNLLTLILLAIMVAIGSTDAFAEAWRRLVTTLPEPALLIGGSLVLHLITFWGLAALYHVVDARDWPRFIAKHRIQDGPRRRPPTGRVLRVVLLNQLFWSPMMLVGMTGALLARGWSASPELPGVGRLVLELAGLGACSVLVFYTTHRFLHRPWWMKHVHRVHHEFRTTGALASEYAHPFEFCVGNFLTLALGVVVLAPSLASIYAFTVLGIMTVVVHHGGYAIPWAPWPVHHDWHHHRFNEMFGTLGVLDRLLGTDGSFRSFTDGEVR
ncbi:MAG: sterol desaturase family protein [Alphaproteobacteria bacterium]|nr:sterol desaturase family protein [Alphaproteobacteria bacterium]